VLAFRFGVLWFLSTLFYAGFGYFGLSFGYFGRFAVYPQVLNQLYITILFLALKQLVKTKTQQQAMVSPGMPQQALACRSKPWHAAASPGMPQQNMACHHAVAVRLGLFGAISTLFT